MVAEGDGRLTMCIVLVDVVGVKVDIVHRKKRKTTRPTKVCLFMGKVEAIV